VVDVVFEAGVDDVEGADAEAEGGGEAGADGGEGVVGEPGGVGEGEIGAVGGVEEGEEDGAGAEGIFESEFSLRAGADEEGVEGVDFFDEGVGGGGSVEEGGGVKGVGGLGAEGGAGAVGGGEENGGVADFFGEEFAGGVAEVEVGGFEAVGFAGEEDGVRRLERGRHRGGGSRRALVGGFGGAGGVEGVEEGDVSCAVVEGGDDGGGGAEDVEDDDLGLGEEGLSVFEVGGGEEDIDHFLLVMKTLATEARRHRGRTEIVGDFWGKRKRVKREMAAETATWIMREHIGPRRRRRRAFLFDIF
jgi:hypothetical protein